MLIKKHGFRPPTPGDKTLGSLGIEPPAYRNRNAAKTLEPITSTIIYRQYVPRIMAIEAALYETVYIDITKTTTKLIIAL